MWSTRQRRRDSEHPRLPAGNAPQRSPSPCYTTTDQGLESSSPLVAKIPPTGTGDERGSPTLPPCASARRQGYVTNARALERAAPVAARGRRLPEPWSTRPRPRPRRPALGARACGFPPYLSRRARPPSAAALLLPCAPSQHLPGDTARRAPPPAAAASRSAATRRPPSGPGSAFAQSRLPTPPLPAPRPPRWRLDLLGWHRAGRALRSTPGALPEPHTEPLRRGKDRGQGGERSADRAAGPGLLARVPASGADSAGIFKLSLPGLAEREKRETALGRKVHLRKAGSPRLLVVDGRKTASPIVLCALGVAQGEAGLAKLRPAARQQMIFHL